ncbi:hypothetical protein M9H77_29754 [Catharanthus roseus]|uniref:Uncharacterized protein n=1 Tax=Catharanthus roseus TaxID=4058 RepID=A0ACB9ZWM2_CATRO|nr:hypothetical protein M9H77_29754 [Catharanthus roseus]
MAAVLEYVAIEILELARNASKDNKKNRIIPQHVLLDLITTKFNYKVGQKETKINQNQWLNCIFGDVSPRSTKDRGGSSSLPVGSLQNSPFNPIATEEGTVGSYLRR